MASGPGALARALAARAVDRVVQGGARLDVALAEVTAGNGLAPRDRAQVQALAFGALRGWHRYRRLAADWVAAGSQPGGVVLALLAVGWFQLEAGDQPDYAIVSATVDAARLAGAPRAAGLVNALLRRYRREGTDYGARHADDPEVRYAHPAWLAARIAADWPDAADAVLAANQAHPDLWVRVNRRRTTPADWAARLAAATGVTAVTVPGLPDALRLAEPLPVEALPGFAAGEVSVQDGGAQLAAPLLDALPGQRVLDACAAPGGKTAHLLERAGDNLELLALDIDAGRLARVASGCTRLGLAGATLVAGDACTPAAWWDGRSFDRILIDAPCSATGVIRRHPDIKLLRRATDIDPLAARQGQMLDALWDLLAPGGVLLYATCSVLRAENEDVVAAFLARQPAAAALPATAALAFGQPTGAGVQLLPGPGATDGFYYALMTHARPGTAPRPA